MSRPPHYPLSNWEQIENPVQVEEIKKRLATLPRLNVYDAPELYDLAYPGFLGDEAFYRPLASQGKVLYLGAGTGRLFAPFAASNPNIIGLDYSRQMLDALLRRHRSIRDDQLVCANAMDKTALPEASFDTIIAPYCFLEVVDRSGAKEILANVATWLKPGGQFVTDEFSPFLIPFRGHGLETISFPVGHYRVTIYITYNHLTQKLTESTVISNSTSTRVTDMDLHYLFPAELIDMMQGAGLDVLSVTGEYTPQPFNASTHDVVVYTCRRPRISP
jgi:SAM-dependent methyltransferase